MITEIVTIALGVAAFIAGSYAVAHAGEPREAIGWVLMAALVSVALWLRFKK